MPAAPAAAETTKGFRFFDLGADGRLLAPFAIRFRPAKRADADVWQAGVNTARCVVSDHPAPSPDCTCGFRVTADLADLLASAERRCAGGTGTGSGLVRAHHLKHLLEPLT